MVKLSVKVKKFIFILIDSITRSIALTIPHSKKSRDVLHISYNVHIASNTNNILKNNGIDSYYMSVGKFNEQESDCHLRFSKNPFIRIFQELKSFRLMSEFKVIHSHFGLMPSRTGWEYDLLRKSGTKFVYHARGCKSRDYKKNLELQPDPLKNICAQCDYNREPCTDYISNLRRARTLRCTDRVIATTPDLLDFLPDKSTHMPFFSPDIDTSTWKDFDFEGGVNIIHVTNHPGIEGTEEIIKIIKELKNEGLKINFEFLQGVPNDLYLEKLKCSHLNIGKMKMGYYANAQIESMAFGVPAVTYIRDEYLTDSINDSALIVCDLNNLKNTLREYVLDTNLILEKRKKCVSTIEKLHNNQVLAQKYNEIYKSLL